MHICAIQKNGTVVAQLLSHVTPWPAAYQASLSFTVSQSFLKFTSIESVMPSSHLILCCPLLFLPSVFPGIRVFFSELVLDIEDLVCKAEIETQTQKTNAWISGGKGGGMNWEIGIDIYTLLILCIKQINSENMLHSTGNSTQCPVET